MQEKKYWILKQLGTIFTWKSVGYNLVFLFLNYIHVLFLFYYFIYLFFAYLRSDWRFREREGVGFESMSKALGFVYDQNFNEG